MRWSSWAFVLLIGSLGCTPDAGGLGSGGDGTPVGTEDGSTGSGSTGPEATTAVTATAGSTMSSDGTTTSVDASSGTTSPLDETNGDTTASDEESSTGSPPPQSLPEVDCAMEGAIASTDDSTRASVMFHNQSGQPRQIDWIDYNGMRDPFGTIVPGDAWGFTTYVTHPWLIADEDGQCLTIFMTEAGTHDIILH